jgi:hypothetical protein
MAARDFELDRAIDDGRALLSRDPVAAHALFAWAARRRMSDPRALSHYGLTLVLVEGDKQRGVRFCEEAVRRCPASTELLLNLARALVDTRHKGLAVRALQRAESLSPGDPDVREELLQIGLRRRPPIPFLPRGFFLNRWVGKLTWRLAPGRR